MKMMKRTKQMLLAASMVVGAAFANAQTTNTVVAQFGTAPDEGNTFTVNLVNTGETKEIAGFAFRVSYNPAQTTLAAVTDNTGQPGAGMQYTMGPEQISEDGLAYREILGATLVNLKDSGNLAELKFEKKSGYVAPFQFKLEDRISAPGLIDGLLGPTVKNVPHEFDSSKVNQ